jgi:predicted O-methyltransferase YrrM
MMSDQAVSVVAAECSKLGQRPDAILIDGDHSYAGVKRDLELYFPLLRPGGVIVVHDYLPVLSEENRDFILYHHKNNEPGIRRACEEFFTSHVAEPVEAPLLYPTDPTQTQAWLPIIPGVSSTIRAWRKR